MVKDNQNDPSFLMEAQIIFENEKEVPCYSEDEIRKAIEVFNLLIKVRDRCRAEGVINW